MEAQQSLQHADGAVRQVDSRACLGQRAQELPLVGSAGVVAASPLLAEAPAPLIDLFAPQKTGRTYPAAAEWRRCKTFRHASNLVWRRRNLRPERIRALT